MPGFHWNSSNNGNHRIRTMGLQKNGKFQQTKKPKPRSLATSGVLHGNVLRMEGHKRGRKKKFGARQEVSQWERGKYPHIQPQQLRHCAFIVDRYLHENIKRNVPMTKERGKYPPSRPRQLWPLRPRGSLPGPQGQNRGVGPSKRSPNKGGKHEK